MQTPLFIFELANNHCGDIDHAKDIIDSYTRFIDEYPEFEFAFKFQYRNLSTFIHPGFINDTNYKYISRFKDTNLTPSQRLELRNHASNLGFKTVCTPFDEDSVDLIEEHNYDRIKIASCSLTDWPLLERVAKTNKPIIASVAGSNCNDIDNVVTFFNRRNKELALMHCVGIYPTPNDKLNLENINYLKKTYPKNIIGYSTHESPKNHKSIQIAIALGAKIFEKHVTINDTRFVNNAYSSDVANTSKWLDSAKDAFKMLGSVGVVDGEVDTLRSLKRAVWAKEDIKKGERITPENVFYAIPVIGDALTANDMSKYNGIFATQNISKGELVRQFNTTIMSNRDTIEKYVQKIQKMLKDANIVLKNGAELELSHHYGLTEFNTYGCSIVNIINREYCKKLLIIFPSQIHPMHKHELKDETFHVLSGDLLLNLNGSITTHTPGDLIPIERGITHGFSSSNGAIVEEISTTHIVGDSYYEDDDISKNKHRKTTLSLWTEDK